MARARRRLDLLEALVLDGRWVAARAFAPGG
jgi:hypothetical protein